VDQTVGARDVVSVALARGLVEGPAAARDEGQDQHRPDLGDSKRDQEAEGGGDDGHRDARDPEEPHAITTIGDDAGRDADEQKWEVPEAQGDAHHDRRIRELQDEPAQDDLLSDHAERVEENAEAQAAKVAVRPQAE